MAEIWEIARYVEEHADDHEQRWRLAKKLYMAWEYRQALEHLQVLKNEWQRKLNVTRYLAATHYRLGRFEEAVAELREGIEEWPGEMGLREQLARVLEVDGNRIAAAEAWEEVLKLDAKHAIASKAARRLRKTPKDTAKEELHLMDSDSGIDLVPGQVCPNCGAQNSADFDRCWQCHGQLTHGKATPRPTPELTPPRIPVVTPESIRMAGALVAAGLLALSAFLSIRMLWAEHGLVSLIQTPRDLYEHELAATRVVLGCLAVALWPLAIRLVLRFVKPEHPVPPALANITGLLLAGLTYVCTWLPSHAVLFAIVAPLAASLAIVLGTFRLGYARGLTTWALHLVIVTVSLLAAFVLIESWRSGQYYNPLAEVPAVWRYTRGYLEEPHPGEHPLPQAGVPIHQNVAWESSGSAWLDRCAGDVGFSVFAEENTGGIKFELKQERTTHVYEDVSPARWFRTHSVTPDTPYEIVVTGPENATVVVRIISLLEPRFPE